MTSTMLKSSNHSGVGCVSCLHVSFLAVFVFCLDVQIAARIRDFVVKASETELVFPSTLTPGERKACRRIAAGEGLGHELRGEESRRTLHIWKVSKARRERNHGFWEREGSRSFSRRFSWEEMPGSLYMSLDIGQRLSSSYVVYIIEVTLTFLKHWLGFVNL